MKLQLSQSKDVAVLTALSKHAFDSDMQVGATQPGGPPGYKSSKFHAKMIYQKHMYTFFNDGVIVGGAILFIEAEKLYIGRIFIDTNHFHEGLGTELMRHVENLFPDVTFFTLDTPIWNVRTNNFYQKIGYYESRRDQECIYYEKIK